MPRYIRVYKDTVKSYLCVRMGDHYEIVAEGNSSSIADLVTSLNEEGDASNE